jgi:hydrogenase maturation protease
MMKRPQILVAGIGNIFFGDDAFGVEVAHKLSQRPLPETVRVIDFGIRGLDLMFALLEDYDTLILVDAVRKGGSPGTLYIIEPEMAVGPDSHTAIVELHALQPEKVLGLAQAMGGNIRHVFLVGCDVAPSLLDDDMQMEMSEPVRAAVDEAVSVIETMIGRLRVKPDSEPCTNCPSL